ncbi:MAG TPA: TIGR02996 domain-containing protein [Gemmataceae bacterium]|nr:TIGR02996 domain-containing protein [Gemmataceae bacterium]
MRVTDDEAFIRAIVSAPGDDAPRLVYADWLDERGDRRGAYLREETVWARDRSPSRWADLTAQAPDLDAVWVARISRPPLGVCDDLALARPGPTLRPSHLEYVEQRLRLKLPSDLYAFLLDRNGGQPADRRLFIVPDGTIFLQVDRFLSIFPRGEPPFAASSLDDLEAVDAAVRSIEGPDLDGYLTIATVENDEYLLIGHEGELADRIFLFAPHWVARIMPVADSLSAFFRELQPAVG